VVSENFGQKTLTALERLRENRIKQTASRIVAAALGLGKDLKPGNDKERFAACHAVVIENLTNYRPDPVRTRRENRQLMNWCAANVKKYLSENCELHGLLLREVQAAYTSRQDSLSGAPGVRCADVPIRDFMASGSYWERELRGAEKANSSGKGNARTRYLVAVRDRVAAVIPNPATEKEAIRVPVDGGPVFVSADPQSRAASGIQADMNAAANIGLRALLDPDWAGRWWYIPCGVRTGAPVADKLKGSAAIPPKLTLFSPDLNEKKEKQKRQVVNLWRDVSVRPLNKGPWRPYAEYRESVMERVTAILLSRLQKLGANSDLPF
jgi:IS605 OrfB family transposase